MRGLKGSRETGTRESQPGDVGPNPSLCPKLADTAELIASGYVPTPVKTDVRTVIPVQQGKKTLTKDFKKVGLRKLQ